MIEFKRSEKTGVIKGKKPVAESFMNWIWTKNVNDILNFKEVMAFLKSLDLHSNPAKTIIIQQEDNQQTLF